VPDHDRNAARHLGLAPQLIVDFGHKLQVPSRHFGFHLEPAVVELLAQHFDWNHFNFTVDVLLFFQDGSFHVVEVV